jgi:hypothetical protein
MLLFLGSHSKADHMHPMDGNIIDNFFETKPILFS